MSDGIGGTDNVEVLFPDKPSAAPLPPQPDIVDALEQYAFDASAGKITGLLMIGLGPAGEVAAVMRGKIAFTDAVSALEQMKFGILARDYARILEQQMNSK